jgi:hypothetical protein
MKSPTRQVITMYPVAAATSEQFNAKQTDVSAFYQIRA